MSAVADSRLSRPIRRTHAFFLATTVPPFLGAALCDYVYTASYQVQWINFAAWLIVGGLVFGAVALVYAFVDWFLDGRGRRLPVHDAVVLVMWAVGFFDVLIHSRDAWATMPTGLVLSVIATILAGLATWLGFSGIPGPRMRGAP